MIGKFVSSLACLTSYNCPDTLRSNYFQTELKLFPSSRIYSETDRRGRQPARETADHRVSQLKQNLAVVDLFMVAKAPSFWHIPWVVDVVVLQTQCSKRGAIYSALPRPSVSAVSQPAGTITNMYRKLVHTAPGGAAARHTAE